MVQTKLKPCPFCGEEDIRKFTEYNGCTPTKYYILFCVECNGEISATSKRRVIKAWNERSK